MYMYQTIYLSNCLSISLLVWAAMFVFLCGGGEGVGQKGDSKLHKKEKGTWDEERAHKKNKTLRHSPN